MRVSFTTNLHFFLFFRFPPDGARSGLQLKRVDLSGIDGRPMTPNIDACSLNLGSGLIYCEDHCRMVLFAAQDRKGKFDVSPSGADP